MITRRFLIGIAASLIAFSLDVILSYAYVRITALMPTATAQESGWDCTQLAAGWPWPEQFIWAQTCAGEIADFNRELKTYADPRIPDQISSDDRRASSKFLETILFRKPFREAVTRNGVRIRGAYFGEEIDMSQGHVSWPLELAHSRFEQDLDMSGLQADRQVSLRESYFAYQVDLRGAVIGGKLDMTGVKVEDTLDLVSAVIGNDVWMRPANYWDESRGLVNIPATTGGIKLKGSKIAGELDMTGAIVERLLDMDSAVVGGGLLMSNARVTEADLRFATIGLNLVLTGAAFRTLGLRGTIIQGELRLNGSDYEWLQNPVKLRSGPDEIEAHLNLQNTKVGIAMISLSAWPKKKVELDGFTYHGLYGLEGTGNFVKWLQRDESFSFQPYQQLASVLRNLGDFGSANRVLYAGKNTELLHETTGFWRRAWLAATWLFVGYGIGVYALLHTLAWVSGFTVLGWIVLRCSGEHKKHCATLGEYVGFWFSFDYFLPAIRLRDAHYEKVDLNDRRVRRYFYVHQFFGYVVGSFFLGGAAGILQ